MLSPVADPGFPRGGAPTYDFVKFSQKLHEIERIWTGGRASLAPPLDPPLITMVLIVKITELCSICMNFVQYQFTRFLIDVLSITIHSHLLDTKHSKFTELSTPPVNLKIENNTFTQGSAYHV